MLGKRFWVPSGLAAKGDFEAAGGAGAKSAPCPGGHWALAARRRAPALPRWRARSRRNSGASRSGWRLTRRIAKGARGRARRLLMQGPTVQLEFREIPGDRPAAGGKTGAQAATKQQQQQQPRGSAAAFCPDSPPQLCRMICQPPSCAEVESLNKLLGIVSKGKERSDCICLFILVVLQRFLMT
ncbi:unnamed protein product [Prorocentrum cordatum]|uniref:Uncharacterized protein n=1 Tax=Prorocentrum cordatum TaxID=2364126 RepID=A0ABN9SEA8_9DINO|nr:unnamed protein product [Polarella glacialis]